MGLEHALQHAEMELTGLGFFHQLDRSLQEELYQIGHLGRYVQDEEILHAGSDQIGLHILLQGRVKVYRRNGEKCLCLSILESGDVFGELAMLTDKDTTASIEAMCDCTVLTIDREAVFAFFYKHPGFVRQFLEYLSLRLRNVIDDVCSIAMDDVYGRLKRILIRLARAGGTGNTIPGITHLELAEMVGSSREMVSIIIKELRQGGYIQTQGRTISLLKELPDKR